jgi:phage baseplate assembly protein W
MAQYIGFSTINACLPQTTNNVSGLASRSLDGGLGLQQPLNPGKKFRLLNSSLVVQDLINALNIRQGQKVGQPNYGSAVWDFLFDPNTLDVQTLLKNEITRVASQDPRVILNSINVFPQENGILVELEMAVAPFNNPALLNIFFNQSTNSAAVV